MAYESQHAPTKHQFHRTMTFREGTHTLQILFALLWPRLKHQYSFHSLVILDDLLPKFGPLFQNGLF